MIRSIPSTPLKPPKPSKPSKTLKTNIHHRINLAPVFERTFQHYRAPIDGLVRVHPRPNKVKELAISLILISRLAEIDLRGYDVEDIPDILETLSAYKALIDHLYDLSVNTFYTHLPYDGLLTTVWETMIQSAISDVDAGCLSDLYEHFYIEAVDYIKHENEPGEQRVQRVERNESFRRFLIVWKLYIQSRQNAIGMIRNWLIVL